MCECACGRACACAAQQARTRHEVTRVSGKDCVPHPTAVARQRLHGAQVVQGGQLDGAVRAADGKQAAAGTVHKRGSVGKAGLALAGAGGKPHLESGLRVHRSVYPLCTRAVRGAENSVELVLQSGDGVGTASVRGGGGGWGDQRARTIPPGSTGTHARSASPPQCPARRAQRRWTAQAEGAPEGLAVAGCVRAGLPTGNSGCCTHQLGTALVGGKVPDAQLAVGAAEDQLPLIGVQHAAVDRGERVEGHLRLWGPVFPTQREPSAALHDGGDKWAGNGAGGAPCVPQLGGGVFGRGEEPLDVALEADGRHVALVPLILDHLCPIRGGSGPRARSRLERGWAMAAQHPPASWTGPRPQTRGQRGSRWPQPSACPRSPPAG